MLLTRYPVFHLSLCVTSSLKGYSVTTEPCANFSNTSLQNVQQSVLSLHKTVRGKMAHRLRVNDFQESRFGARRMRSNDRSKSLELQARAWAWREQIPLLPRLTAFPQPPIEFYVARMRSVHLTVCFRVCLSFTCTDVLAGRRIQFLNHSPKLSFQMPHNIIYTILTLSLINHCSTVYAFKEYNKNNIRLKMIAVVIINSNISM
jgi:hypothetical protein